MVSTRDVLLKVLYPFVVAQKTISRPHGSFTHPEREKTIFILLVGKLSLDAVLYLIL